LRIQNHLWSDFGFLEVVILIVQNDCYKCVHHQSVDEFSCFKSALAGIMVKRA
jgi:hypothetical protein